MDENIRRLPERPTARSIHEGTGRRAFLAALSAAAVGLGFSQFLSVDDIVEADRDQVPIVYGFVRSAGDGPGTPTLEPLTKQVPAEWYDELRRAVVVHGQFVRVAADGYLGSYVKPGDYSNPGASITVHASTPDVEELLANLSPDLDVNVDVIDGLPPRPDETIETEPNTVADLTNRTVPGGVLCGRDDSQGTLAPAVYHHGNGDRYFATSNHIYGGSGTDHQGEPLDLFSGTHRTPIGRVWRGYAREDIVLATPTNGYVPRSKLDRVRGGTVGGQLTKVGLADLKARGERLEMAAAVSGLKTGAIKGIDGVTFYTGAVPKTGQLVWGDESTFTDGDSGSVNYYRDPQNADRLLIGGLNNARTWWPGVDFTWGTAAYHLRDRHGLTF